MKTNTILLTIILAMLLIFSVIFFTDLTRKQGITDLGEFKFGDDVSRIVEAVTKDNACLIMATKFKDKEQIGYFLNCSKDKH